jgi:ribosomal protein L29
MDHDERDEWLANSQAESEELRADIDRRRKAREAGEVRQEWRAPGQDVPTGEMQYRSNADSLVQTTEQAGPQNKTATMDAEASAAWNKWFDGRLLKFADEYSNAVVELLMREVNRARDDGREARLTAIIELKAEIAELRSELTEVRSELSLAKMLKPARLPTGPRTRSTNGEIHVPRRN